MILPTQNKAHGFWGTFFNTRDDGHGKSTQRAWDAMSTVLAKEFRLNPAEVRYVLDSTLGRHLADQVSTMGMTGFTHTVRSLNRAWRYQILDVAQEANAR